MALTLYLLFIALAVIVRVSIHFSLTGNLGIRSPKKNSSMASKISSFVYLTSFLIIFIVAIFDAKGNLNQLIGDNQITMIAGSIIGFFGTALTVISQHQMGAAWRLGVDEAEKTILVTTGIYKYIRNPIYSGVILFGMGMFLLSPNIYMMGCLFFVCLSIEIHVRYVEEPHLSRLHGVAYIKYCNHSGKYFPKFEGVT